MIDNTAKREAASKAEQGKAAAKGAANAATGKASAAKEKITAAFSDLKGDAVAMLKGLKDSLGIPNLPKFPKKPAFKELKKFEPKKAPEPKAFQKEEKKFEFGQAAPVTTPAPKQVQSQEILVETYKGYEIYKKVIGPFTQFTTYYGQPPAKVLIHTGPDSRSDSDTTLISYEKNVIDERISKISRK